MEKRESALTRVKEWHPANGYKQMSYNQISYNNKRKRHSIPLSSYQGLGGICTKADGAKNS